MGNETTNEIVEIEIRVVTELAYRPDTGWGSYGCVPKDYEDYPRVSFNKYGNMSVKGKTHRLDSGAVCKLRAKIVNDPKWGVQYEIMNIYQEIPATIEEIKEYVKNFVTPLQFKAIYDVYPDQDVIELMKNDTFDYSKVSGMGSFTYEKIKERLLSNLELQELINEFPDLNYGILNKLLKKYTSPTLLKEKLNENPYILTDLAGIGFRTADEIALKIGIDSLSPFRIHAALRHVIREVETNGDTYIKESTMISRSYALLKVKKNIIKEHLLTAEGLLKIDTRYCLERTFKQEKELAERLLNMKNYSTTLDFDVEKFIEEQEKLYSIKLTNQQKEFFYNFRDFNVSLLVGYAGCGKSMLQRLCINLIEKLNLSFALMAPTGKASKVLSKYTDRPAWTIHKKTNIGKRDDSGEAVGSSIYEDVIIVDESSMCGVALAHVLVHSIMNSNARIVFIGDDFQIPSVDKGNFLYDMKESGQFPTAMLDIVFRQSEGGILDLVTSVRLGKKFIEDDFRGIKKFGDNCILVACPQEKMEKGYKHYYKELLENYGAENIMVLSATKKGKLGTHSINRNLQEIANPPNEDHPSTIQQIKDGEPMILRVDDNVINTSNTYELLDLEENKIDIMNGDTGVILEVNSEMRNVIVDFDGVKVLISSNILENLLHSFALTKHKSQGSAAKAVMSISDKSHFHQLNANLLYVAWTRPEEFLIILCQPETLNMALQKFENLRRNTFLCEILKGEIEVI